MGHIPGHFLPLSTWQRPLQQSLKALQPRRVGSHSVCRAGRHGSEGRVPPKGLGTLITTSHWFSKGVALAPKPTAHRITFAIKRSLAMLYRDAYFRLSGKPRICLSPRHPDDSEERGLAESPPLGTAAYRSNTLSSRG